MEQTNAAFGHSSSLAQNDALQIHPQLWTVSYKTHSITVALIQVVPKL